VDVFFMLTDLFKQNDPDLKFHVLAACGQMRAGLTNIIVNLRAKGGSPEISRRIEDLSEVLFGKIQKIKEAADAIPVVALQKPVDLGKKSGGFNLIIQKRNAEETVNTCRKELRDAEEQVKRLNRAMARKF
jgi:hypothetical protein